MEEVQQGLWNKYFISTWQTLDLQSNNKPVLGKEVGSPVFVFYY
ncbi:hypothetical protein RINTHM_11560 [Richelia intracellularis HM01]|nr:hypothetical protein RINTHM_11560 [Richelia intracellularis HM01]